MFIPAADEVGRLQRGDGPECEMFRQIAEQGHYAGRTQPTGTRQGIYATTPSGVLLASVNTTNPRRVASMLETALAQWNETPAEMRYLPNQPAENAAPVRARWERLYPKDGLVLRVNSRDLPRPEGDQSGGRRRRGWRQLAWNQDYAWFRQSEMMTLLPEKMTIGETTRVPSGLLTRLLRLHLIDNVRGQVSRFNAKDVLDKALSTRITDIAGDRVTLVLEGHSRAVNPGSAPDEPLDPRQPQTHERGVETTMLGVAEFDRQEMRFVRFDLIALGTRWGGTKYNGREHDLEPHAIGFALSLADDDPPVAPAFIWEYRWRE